MKFEVTVMNGDNMNSVVVNNEQEVETYFRKHVNTDTDFTLTRRISDESGERESIGTQVVSGI